MTGPERQGWQRRLPWIDASAALVVGLLVVTFLEPLSQLYSLPPQVLRCTAAANLGYPVLGLCLGGLPRSAASVRRGLLNVLVTANYLWAIACVGLALRFGAGASAFGLVHLIGEALFVAMLATLQWRHRRLIVVQPGCSRGAS